EDKLRRMAVRRSDVPFVREVPKLLKERGLSVRGLAREVGVTDAHLSRVLRGVDYKTVSGDLAGRVALALDLPQDYFPEFRQAFVIDRIRRDDQLRERLYKQLRKHS
ncbi:MAG TPA: helix-turn-helix domain-containing protein, partial [Gaiellaceae bacterium]